MPPAVCLATSLSASSSRASTATTQPTSSSRDKTCTSSSTRLLHTLKRLRCTLSKAALTLYYCLYIRPLVESGCVAWPKLPAHLRDRLERFQRRAFKLMLRKPLFEHCDHDAMLLAIQQPSLESRREYQLPSWAFNLRMKLPQNTF